MKKRFSLQIKEKKHVEKKEISCCFTGHRPAKLPWKYRETDPRCIALKKRIADAVWWSFPV